MADAMLYLAHSHPVTAAELGDRVEFIEEPTPAELMEIIESAVRVDPRVDRLTFRQRLWLMVFGLGAWLSHPGVVMMERAAKRLPDWYFGRRAPRDFMPRAFQQAGWSCCR